CTSSLFFHFSPFIPLYHLSLFFLMLPPPPRSTLFPTRRSSDLIIRKDLAERAHENLPTILQYRTHIKDKSLYHTPPTLAVYIVGDRKSTRLNSSHVAISYAVFCLKKKKNKVSCFIILRFGIYVN